ncbi:MAG: putative endonuclease [Candidatus Dependentiae bacterium]|nr:putative endonuclease [Candidatus Dependentiae bacterium]
MKKMQPAVYVMASGRNGTLYTGVTSNLIKRVYEHKICKKKKSFQVLDRHPLHCVRGRDDAG